MPFSSSVEKWRLNFYAPIQSQEQQEMADIMDASGKCNEQPLLAICMSLRAAACCH